MGNPRFSLIETEIGCCALIRKGTRVTGFLLPQTLRPTPSRAAQSHKEGSARSTPLRNDSEEVTLPAKPPATGNSGHPFEACVQQIGATEEAAPPDWVRKLHARIQSHLRGDLQDFANVPVDVSQQPPFTQKVLEHLHSLPTGIVLTYHELAKRLGKPGSARAVGQAMGRNPIPLLIPCHRIVAANGRLGGYSGPGGIILKKRLLTIEGLSPLPVPSAKKAVSPCSAPKSRPKAVRTVSAPLSLDQLDIPDACRRLAKADPALGRAMRRIGPCGLQVESLVSPFQALLEAIVYQQLTGKAAATIFGRVRDLFSGQSGIRPFDIIRATEDDLRSCGLSRAKVASMKDLAEKTQAGLVPDLETLRTMTDDEIIQSLTLIRGIGRWTAEMMLIFRLGRPDVLAIHDYGLQKGLMAVHDLPELPKPKALEAAGQAWIPYRSLASWYLWRAAETFLPGRA